MLKKILLLLLCSLCIFPSYTYAEETKPLEEQIKELQQKISDAQNKERTLAGEIKSMDASINLTTLQVKETEVKISTLGKEIEELGGKITTLEGTLSQLSKVLITRMIAGYKTRSVSPVELLLTSNGVTDLIKRTKYIELVQEHDHKVLTDVQIAKTDYGEQKDVREEKKVQQEKLKKDLLAQQQKLATQKKQKESLLTQTKNDEATYQRLLAQAIAEKQAIEAALISGEKQGPVKKGDAIALVGNTGYPACSTGAHLHFEVRKNNSWTNPSAYLQSKSIATNQSDLSSPITIGNGSWDWPLRGDIIMTQNYGVTPYSFRYAYSGGIHTGIDMYSYSSPIIYAPSDGTLYSASQNCGGSSVIKIKYIEHSDGVVSFYLHVQ